MALIFSATTLEISHDTLPQRAPGATCCQLGRLCFHQCLSGYLRSQLLLGRLCAQMRPRLVEFYRVSSSG